VNGKPRKPRWGIRALGFALAVPASLALLCPDAFAAEGPSTARKIWDNVMLFVNFGILVFVFIKFGKKPLMDYLRGQGKRVGEELDTINARIAEAKAAMETETDKIEGIDQIVEEIRQSMIAIGEKERDQIIAQGRSAAEKMIQDAEAYAHYRIETVRKALADELVEKAVSVVEERLAETLTQEENTRFVDHFLAELETTEAKERFARKQV
jgi:F-type H+-transporting ATPase subunit b